jgi:hypothetical protein
MRAKDYAAIRAVFQCQVAAFAPLLQDKALHRFQMMRAKQIVVDLQKNSEIQEGQAAVGE